MVFQVDAFCGMKRGHIKLDGNVSFRFKGDKTNAASKIKCNMILSISSKSKNMEASHFDLGTKFSLLVYQQAVALTVAYLQ